jgi:hypothetical protein
VRSELTADAQRWDRFNEKVITRDGGYTIF